MIKRRRAGWWTVLVVALMGLVLGAGRAWGQQAQKVAGAATKAGDEAARQQAEAEQLYKNGKYGEAIPPAERALAMREKALGPDHPSVANDLQNYGTMLKAANRDAEAEPLLARAKAIRDKRGRSDPPAASTAPATRATGG